MSEPLSLDEAAAILFDERKYENPLTAKEFHKLSYFLKKSCEAEGVSTDIPFFWYKYGAVAKTSNSDLQIRNVGEKTQVLPPSTDEELQFDDDLESTVRKAAREALLKQYSKKTIGLTDEMYGDAPYEFQRHYRKLDKQLTTARVDRRDILKSEYDSDAIRATVMDFTRSFPFDNFSEFKQDVLRWYRAIRSELNEPHFDAQNAHEVSDILWTTLSVEIARKESDELSFREIAEELGETPQSLNRRQQKMSERLKTREKESREESRVSKTHAITESAGQALGYSVSKSTIEGD